MIDVSGGGKVCAVLALFLFLFLYLTPDILTGLETTEDFCLIIVSDLDPIDHEVEKACDLKEYLVGDGFDPAYIIFLAPNGTDGSDGEPIIEMMENVFGILSTHGELFDCVTVYISDHLPPLSTNGSCFRFLDGNVSLSTFNDWLGEIDCEMLQIYVGGDHSGASGVFLWSEGRELICSMGADRTAIPDEFSLVRGYSCSGAEDDQYYPGYLIVESDCVITDNGENPDIISEGYSLNCKAESYDYYRVSQHVEIGNIPPNYIISLYSD